MAQLSRAEPTPLIQSFLCAVLRVLVTFPEGTPSEVSRFYPGVSTLEFAALKSHFVISSWGGIRKLPYAFTEQGLSKKRRFAVVATHGSPIRPPIDNCQSTISWTWVEYAVTSINPLLQHSRLVSPAYSFLGAVLRVFPARLTCPIEAGGVTLCQDSIRVRLDIRPVTRLPLPVFFGSVFD